MAETLSQIFERMRQELSVLVEKYNNLYEKYKELGNQNAELEQQILQQRKEIERLQTENEYLKIATTIAPDKEMLKKSRNTIAKLVRDVEKCIEQLNN